MQVLQLNMASALNHCCHAETNFCIGITVVLVSMEKTAYVVIIECVTYFPVCLFKLKFVRDETVNSYYLCLCL